MGLMSTAVVVNLGVEVLLKAGFTSCLGQYSAPVHADLLRLASLHTKVVLVSPRPAASSSVSASLR